MVRLFTVFFLILSLDVSAQLIKGQVLIYGTEDPLPDASVYYDGRYKGGFSDENGYFQLDSATSGKNPIVISAVGYHSTSIADYSAKEFLKVYLQPKVYSLDAVVVTYDGMTREEKEAIFKKEFIGKSKNSLECEILNIDDINLMYNRKRKTVEAFAKEPILLYNKALGFKITYYLDQFLYTPENVFFSGNYFFEPDTTLSGKALARVEKKRKEAYLGSRMHFIRSLYKNRLRQEGFSVLKLGHGDKDNTGLVVDTEDGKSIFMKSRLAIIYKGFNKNVTFLDKVKDFTFIDKNGFYDPSGVTWSGVMANQRVGDLLPFEYDSSRSEKR